MNKSLLFSLAAVIPLILAGCAASGEKSSSITVVYLIATILSFLFLIGCITLLKKSEPWMLLLCSSIFVVNFGYYVLSISDTLDLALWANRIAYLGSTLLPLAMLMLIVKVAGIKKPKWLSPLLFSLAAAVFFCAATQGFLDIYYKEVTLGSYNGATVLIKEYGPLHPVNLIYLMGYTIVTAIITVRTVNAKKLRSNIETVILVASVFLNIGVWLIEQIVRIEFELLSLSYIITELFLLGLFLMIKEDESAAELPAAPAETPVPASVLPTENEYLAIFRDGVERLTPTERLIYNHYVDGKGTKDIMAMLNITENTLKYHNKNIYSKLGVSSRKQLIEIHKLIQQ